MAEGQPLSLAGIDTSSAQLIKTLIGQIYDAACDARHWQTVLHGITELTRSKSAVLLYQDHEVHHASTFAAFGLEPKWLTLYNQQFGEKDPALAIIASVPTGHLTASHLFPGRQEMLYESDTYKEFYQPQDIFHLAGTWLIKSEQRSAMLGFQRGHDTEPYEPEVFACIEELIPHLQRAFHIHRTYTASVVKSEALASGIDSMQMGLIFFDHQTQITYCNQAAENIIAQHPALTMRNGTIHATSEADNKTLRKALSDASLANLYNTPIGNIAIGLKHPAAFTPLPILISPIHQSDIGASLTKGTAAVVMAISDPERMLITSPSLLATIYGLTPAESEVAIDLINALSPQEIAEKKNVKIATIRSQIQSVYSKTGVNSQAQLIKSLLSSPLVSFR